MRRFKYTDIFFLLAALRRQELSAFDVLQDADLHLAVQGDRREDQLPRAAVPDQPAAAVYSTGRAKGAALSGHIQVRRLPGRDCAEAAVRQREQGAGLRVSRTAQQLHRENTRTGEWMF